MNRKLAAAVAGLLLLGWPFIAGAQSASAPERPAASGESGLNLKLDDAATSRPRIQFGPAKPAPKPAATDAGSTLPQLGADPGGPSFDRPPPGSRSGPGSGGPYPKDTNPNL